MPPNSGWLWPHSSTSQSGGLWGITTQPTSVESNCKTRSRDAYFTMSIVTDLLTGIFEFVADVLMFRRQRDKEGLVTRNMADDAVAVARFDFFTTLWIALVSAGLMFLLIFGFDVPVIWGIGIGTIIGVVWGCRRYSQLVR